MKASWSQILTWLQDVQAGAWQWGRNSRCKYVTIKIDTRRGVWDIRDRDDRIISLEELTYQLRSTPPRAK